MASRDRISQRDRGSTRPGTTSVAGTLAVAAGYGLAISALTVLTGERMFGTRGLGGRLAVLAVTVGVLVLGAAASCARRSWQRHHAARSNARRA